MKSRLLAITLLFLLVLYVGATVFGTDALRKSQISELNGEAALTAQSVAMSLVPAIASRDTALAKSNIDHMFDPGRHQHMVLRGASGEAVVERRSETRASGAPSWFSVLMRIPEFVGRAPVAAGSGEHLVEVAVHADLIERRIWSYCLKLSWLFLITGFCLWLLISLVLRVGFRPLSHAIKLNGDMLDGRYSNSPELDFVVAGDVADAVRSANKASWHVGQLNDEWRDTVNVLEDERDTDMVTGLLNRYGARRRLESLEAPGFVGLLELRNVEDRRRLSGIETTDQYIANVAASLRGACAFDERGWIARIDSGLFIVACSKYAPDKVESLVLRVMASLEDSGIDTGDISAGFVSFASGESGRVPIDAAEIALARARRNVSGELNIVVREISSEPLQGPVSPRRSRLRQIREKGVALAYRPVMDIRENVILHDVVATLSEDDGARMDVLQTRAQVQSLDLENEFDKLVLETLMQCAEDMSGFVLPVSAVTCADPGLREAWLSPLLELEVGQRPVVALPAIHTRSGGRGQDLGLIDLLEQRGVRYVLDCNGAELGLPAVCSPEFVRLPRHVGHGLTSTDERSAAASLRLVTTLISSLRQDNIPILLSGIDTREAWEQAKTLGIGAAQGDYPGLPTTSLPRVDRLEPSVTPSSQR